MPLHAGYSRATVNVNIAQLLREGHDRNAAIVAAMNAARASFFARHPQGALPEWMAWPKGRRLAAHYAPNGAPMKTNPVPASRVLQGKKLFQDFTGHTADDARRVQLPDFPVGVAIGQIIGIMYQTVRDGRTEKYVHQFRKISSRPLLIVSHDGKQFRTFGGRFKFTDRGFVDS